MASSLYEMDAHRNGQIPALTWAPMKFWKGPFWAEKVLSGLLSGLFQLSRRIVDDTWPQPLLVDLWVSAASCYPLLCPTEGLWYGNEQCWCLEDILLWITWIWHNNRWSRHPRCWRKRFQLPISEVNGHAGCLRRNPPCQSGSKCRPWQRISPQHWHCQRRLEVYESKQRHHQML